LTAPPDDPHREAIQELYDSAPCGLLTTLPNGSIVAVNHTFCSWMGVSADELVGHKRWQDLMTVGCKIFHQTHWMPLMQIQGSVAEVQLEFASREGTTLPALVNGRQRGSGDQLRHDIAVFVANDRRKYERELLSARRRAEQLLESERKAQAALAEALRQQEQQAHQRAVLAEQLIGIVSHDLRTPLNAVALGASLLAAGDVSAAQARTVGRISSATQRASRLIADLLDFTQARLARWVAELMRPTVRACAALTSPAASRLAPSSTCTSWSPTASKNSGSPGPAARWSKRAAAVAPAWPTLIVWHRW